MGKCARNVIIVQPQEKSRSGSILGLYVNILSFKFKRHFGKPASVYLYEVLIT